MDAYYLAQANLLARLALHTDRDGIYPTGYWQQQIYYLNPILESEYGRAWFTDLRSSWPPGFLEAGLDRIEQMGPPTCASDLRDRLQRIQRQRSKSDDAYKSLEWTGFLVTRFA